MRQFWQRKKREQELEEEVRSHLEMARKDRVERGQAVAEAERAARREFGNEGLVKELTKDVWGGRCIAGGLLDAGSTGGEDESGGCAAV